MDLVECVESHELTAQWQFATSQFLIAEPSWPGGAENQQRVIDWVCVHSLEDAIDKVGVLRLAFSELKSTGEITETSGWTH